MTVLFAALELIGGLAFFLYGMNVMSGGLGKLAGGSLERSLKKATSNPILGMGLGAGITIAIQSSSAMTVMLVGLVNSGLMQFDQTINVIMGSNIGTTVTNWILSLSGVDGEGWHCRHRPDHDVQKNKTAGSGQDHGWLCRFDVRHEFHERCHGRPAAE